MAPRLTDTLLLQAVLFSWTSATTQKQRVYLPRSIMGKAVADTLTFGAVIVVVADLFSHVPTAELPRNSKGFTRPKDVAASNGI